MPYYYRMPVDPECPAVQEFYEGFWDDPITEMSGCGDEISEDFDQKHMTKCKRCQEFGAANIEVAD